MCVFVCVYVIGTEFSVSCIALGKHVGIMKYLLYWACNDKHTLWLIYMPRDVCS